MLGFGDARRINKMTSPSSGGRVWAQGKALLEGFLCHTEQRCDYATAIVPLRGNLHLVPRGPFASIRSPWGRSYFPKTAAPTCFPILHARVQHDHSPPMEDSSAVQLLTCCHWVNLGRNAQEHPLHCKSTTYNRWELSQGINKSGIP